MAVYFYGCVSLDGYLAACDHGLDWLYETGTTEDTGYDEFYARMDVALMGRRTFAEVAKLDDPASAYPPPRTSSSPMASSTAPVSSPSLRIR